MARSRCKAKTKSGSLCKLKPDSSGYCHVHNPDKIKYEEVMSVIYRVCEATSWKYVFQSLDCDNWKYAVIKVSREIIQHTIVCIDITAELHISINEEGVRVSPTCTSPHSYGLKDLYHSIMTELRNLSWLEFHNDKDKPKPKAPFEIVKNICLRFHSIARQLRNRYDNRETLDVEDEYDVQDLLHALLILHFDDIRPEEWTPSYAGSSSRMDFLLKDEKMVIEVKKTRKGLNAKKLGEELLIDIQKYKQHPDCSILVCFVYDPDARIANPRGIENDLNRKDGELPVRVLITPR